MVRLISDFFLVSNVCEKDVNPIKYFSTDVVFAISGESASGADDWTEYEELRFTSGRDGYDASHDFQFVSSEPYIIELCVCKASPHQILAEIG